MEPQTRPSRLSLILAFAAIYIIWGSTYLGIRYAIQTIPPLLMSGVRYFIAGLAVYLISMAGGAPRPAGRHWKNTAIIGALLLLMGNGGVAMAEKLIPTGIAALIVCSVPIWFALFGWLFFKKGKPVPRTIAGIALGFIGIMVLVGPGNLMPGGTPINLNGVIIITIGTIGWSMGSLFASRAELPSNHLTTTGMQMLCGGLLLMLAGLVKGEYSQFQWAEVSRESIIAIVYLIIFGSMVAFSAYSWLVRVSSPSLVSTYAYVNPVIAVFLGWLFLNEAIDRYTIIGSVIIVGALILITTAKPIVIEEVPE
jgi:drug/metabolite transporter (DMT)-like permease